MELFVNRGLKLQTPADARLKIGEHQQGSF